MYLDSAGAFRFRPSPLIIARRLRRQLEDQGFSYSPMQAVRCPLCGATVEGYPEIDARLHLPLQVSTHCDLRFLNPRMTAAAYAVFYARHYRPLVTTWATYFTRRVLPDPLPKDILSLLSTAGWTPRWVLDVGGGDGSLLAALGFSGTVIDPCADDLLKAATRGFATIHGTAETAALPSADLALCARVADHWLDPLTILQRLPTRWLYIDYTICPYKVDHPLYWSQASMTTALALTGWSPVMQVTRPTLVSFLCKRTLSPWMTTMVPVVPVTMLESCQPPPAHRELVVCGV